MKVLFCHDGPILKDEYNNYYGAAHNDEMFKRYHIIADKIGVLIRVKNVDKEHVMQKYSRITLSTLDIIECPNLSNIKGILNKRKIKKIIKNEIIKSDYIVIR
ncbi:MAG: glycosyl transferase, partial [Bacilli bacterium]|nr:glycosyl transferase [Bacilli bacterium]